MQTHHSNSICVCIDCGKNVLRYRNMVNTSRRCSVLCNDQLDRVFFKNFQMNWFLSELWLLFVKLQIDFDAIHFTRQRTMSRYWNELRALQQENQQHPHFSQRKKCWAWWIRINSDSTEHTLQSEIQTPKFGRKKYEVKRSMIFAMQWTDLIKHRKINAIIYCQC